MGCGTAFRAAEPYRCKGCAKGAMTARVRWEGRRYQPCRLVWPPVLAANDLDGLGLVNLPECVHTHLHTARAASVCPCTDKNFSHSGQICAAIAGNAHWLQAFSLQLISCFQPIQQWAERGLSKGCTRSLGYTFAAVIGLGLLNLYLPLQQAMEASKSAAVSTNSSCTACDSSHLVSAPRMLPWHNFEHSVAF